MSSYRIFEQLQKILPADGASGHGVRMRVANFFFDKPIEENQEEYEKMCEIEEAKVRACACLRPLRGTVSRCGARSAASSATPRW